MPQQGFVLNTPVVLFHMVRRELNRVKLAEQAVCSERYLRMALNEGYPVSEEVLTRLGRVLGVAQEELLANPADRERVRGTVHDAVINRFYAAMFGGHADEALEEFAEGAVLHLHHRSREILSLLGMGSRESGEFAGRAAVGGALRGMCGLARVLDAKEWRRTPMLNHRVLSEGWVKQKIVSTGREVDYDFVLIFDLATGGKIERLDMHYETHEIEEGLRPGGPS
jgi:hypothetical protein